jgi:hypothetical protein
MEGGHTARGIPRGWMYVLTGGLARGPQDSASVSGAEVTAFGGFSLGSAARAEAPPARASTHRTAIAVPIDLMLMMFSFRRPVTRGAGLALVGWISRTVRPWGLSAISCRAFGYIRISGHPRGCLPG